MVLMLFEQAVHNLYAKMYAAILFLVRPLREGLQSYQDSTSGASSSSYLWCLPQKLISRIADTVERYYRELDAKRRMNQATEYDDWKEAAQDYDRVSGAVEWSKDPESSFYDYELIRERLTVLKQLWRAGDVERLVHALRGGLNRNLGGIANPALYEYSKTGTKSLIEEYIDTVVNCLLYIARENFGETMPPKKKLVFFRETRHAFGRTALLLSGGASWAFNHLGVVKAMLEAGVLPRTISGSSGGALVAGWVCCKTDAELAREIRPDAIKLGPFEELHIGSFERKLKRVFSKGYLLNIEVLKKFAQYNIGNYTFLDAYRRTGRILNVPVTSSSSTPGDPGILLNYLTSPNVLVWSAVLASSALPFVFEAVTLQAKDADGTLRPYHIHEAKWVDGSIANDLPMERLAELFNINQFIVSQVNPWVVPFLSRSDLKISDMQWNFEGILARAWFLFSQQIRSYAELAAETGIFPHNWNRALRLIFQTYKGDITVVPAEISVNQYLSILSNPSNEFLQNSIKRGQRATWPKLSRILSRCAIEQALDQCVRQLQHEPMDGQYTLLNYRRNRSFTDALSHGTPHGRLHRSSSGSQGRLDMDMLSPPPPSETPTGRPYVSNIVRNGASNISLNALSFNEDGLDQGQLVEDAEEEDDNDLDGQCEGQPCNQQSSQEEGGPPTIH
eukprot:gb/GECG01002122.1/.p1 GENE.gb/GECG01002122.1/~~gb/GECG01002122.1/.p1  ORF type:complete len:676 (+),score=70.60 gb/GECG01002122.1/:1-2028(+)